MVFLTNSTNYTLFQVLQPITPGIMFLVNVNVWIAINILRDIPSDKLNSTYKHCLYYYTSHPPYSK